MVLLLAVILADKTIFADEAENERFDLQAAKADFTVGDDEASLYDVADSDFCFQLLVDDLDIHVGFRYFTAFDVSPFHFMDDWQDSGTEFKVVQTAIPCR